MSKKFVQETLESYWDAEKLIDAINEFAAKHNIPLSDIDVRACGYATGWEPGDVKYQIELGAFA